MKGNIQSSVSAASAPSGIFGNLLEAHLPKAKSATKKNFMASTDQTQYLLGTTSTRTAVRPGRVATTLLC